MDIPPPLWYYAFTPKGEGRKVSLPGLSPFPYLRPPSVNGSSHVWRDAATASTSINRSRKSMKGEDNPVTLSFDPTIAVR